MADLAGKPPQLFRVGELAREAKKSVRALHLYEELGLLCPKGRTQGGFRLYDHQAVRRIEWISKLQAIGFSLTEIQGFVREFERAECGKSATDRVREVFSNKLAEVRADIARLKEIEGDLGDALAYLGSCQRCDTQLSTESCHDCEHQGHEPGAAPSLFAGLSSAAVDVQVAKLRRGES